MIWSQDNWTIGTSGMGIPDDRQFDCQRAAGFTLAAGLAAHHRMKSDAASSLILDEVAPEHNTQVFPPASVSFHD